MAAPKFSEDVRPLTDLKTKTASVIEQVRRSRRPMLLTRRGRGLAVLLDLGEYERLVDRAAFVAAVDKGRKAAAAGDLHDSAEAMAILDDFGKPDGQET
jgi:prevent-host-death family protein